MSQKAVRRNIIKPEPEPERVSIVEVFKTRLGWNPPKPKPFHTAARRGCGGCHQIKSGSEFDVPVTQRRPDLNLCRECENR